VDILVTPDRVVHWHGQRYACALGPAGVVTAKHEGDGATPAGSFPLRRVLYRPDRVARPRTALAVAALDPLDAWCDDPADPAYNRQVRQPYAASFEPLWRAAPSYDVMVILGHNDDPVVPGRGSAVFLHLAWADYRPTAGCVALAAEHLAAILEGATAESRLIVSPE